MIMIRVAFALFALTACVVIDAHSAAAEIYRPWCVVYTGRGGRSCAFTSFEQCMMTGGPGTGGSCVQNPWYLWYGEHGQGRGGDIPGSQSGNEARRKQHLSKVEGDGCSSCMWDPSPPSSQAIKRAPALILRPRN
jgi:hypothetical protein